MGQKEKHSEEGENQKNWFEWLVFATSLLVVLSIISYLIYQVFQPNDSTPDLVTESFSDPSEHAPYRYRVELHNKGGETAEEVKLEVVLQSAGESVSKAELDFPYAPHGSKREGWVNFDKKPGKTDTVFVRVVSYKRP